MQIEKYTIPGTNEESSFEIRIYERIEQVDSILRLHIRDYSYTKNTDAKFYERPNYTNELKESISKSEFKNYCKQHNDKELEKLIIFYTELGEENADPFTSKRSEYLDAMKGRLKKWYQQYGFDFPESKFQSKLSANDFQTTISEYITTCSKLKKHIPTLDELHQETSLSKATWSRKLKDVGFLFQLMRNVKKKINYAKKQEKKDFWFKVYYEIELMMGNVKNKITASRETPYNDNLENQ